jgi:hypothetical protein
MACALSWRDLSPDGGALRIPLKREVDMNFTPAGTPPGPEAGSSARTAPSAQTYTLFQEPWWLDAVAPGQWKAVTVERGGAVVARMPYIMRRRYAMTWCDLPPLTQTLGPWLTPAAANGSTARRIADEKELMNALIAGLPPADLFRQSFSYAVTNWMPFHWAGFRQTTRYTYVLEDLSDLDRLWAGLLTDARTAVRKAEKRLVLRDDLGVACLYELVTMTFRRQGLAPPYSQALLERVVGAALARDQGYMMFAEDAKGRVHGGLFNAFDQRSAFGLVSGFDPELRSSAANALLIWESIKHAHAHSRAFDFEGSMLEPVESAIRPFGGTPKPYFRITRASRRMRLVEAGREFAKALAGR